MPMEPNSLLDNSDSVFIATSSSSRGRGRGRGSGSLGRGGGRVGVNGEERYYDYCHKPGHLEDQCWKKHGRPDWAPRKDSSSTATTQGNALAAESAPSSTNVVTRTHEDFEHLLKLAHSDSSLPSTSMVHSGTSTSILYGIKWLVDSGATDHMSSHMHLFSTYAPFWIPVTITPPDGVCTW